MAITLLPYPYIIVPLVQVGYPMMQTWNKALGDSPKEYDYAQWMVHWVVCTVWMVLESTFLWFLVDYFPFFLELKLLFFLWMVHPDFLGGAFLWYEVVKPLYTDFDEKYYSNIMGLLEKVKAPSGLEPPAAPEASNKDSVIEEELNKKKG
mmetsp:Transcript_8246/g.14235  ORF Transcript_8246/g.14235 Transcript_8246/m.14235 type:complete len:150 (-) Transcript_8246:98-547(-)